MLGKKLYKTGMINIFRLIILSVVIFFTNDFILDTYTYEKFQLLRTFKLLDILEYHYKYPSEFAAFFFVILGPSFYYSFIRGVRFHEKGFVYNRGIPFMNRIVLYSEIETYKMLHPTLVLAIHTKKGEVYVIADNSVERIVAILDQHNIQGNLAQDEYAKLITNFRKFMMVVLAFTLIVFVAKKLGLFQVS